MAIWLVLAVLAGSALPNPLEDLAFTQPEVNLGTVYTGAKLTHEFTFRNKSKGVLRVVAAHAECGCTKPGFTKLEYQPGEKGKLTLEVQTLTQSAGPHTWEVHITYETGGVERELEVCLRAQLVSEVAVQPAKLVVSVEHAHLHPFMLEDKRRTPIEVLQANTNVPGVSVRLGEYARDDAGPWRRAIHLIPSPELVVGRHEGQLSLYTAEDRYQHLQVPFTIVKAAPEQVTAMPREVDIRATAGKPVPSTIVVLRGPVGERIEVAEALADNPAISLRLATNKDGIVAIRVQVDVQRLGMPSLDSAIHIRLAKPSGETLKIPIHFKVGN
jgi:Protein of unknown function (DUF1573)